MVLPRQGAPFKPAVGLSGPAKKLDSFERAQLQAVP
jgi:hypothetical protein